MPASITATSGEHLKTAARFNRSVLFQISVIVGITLVLFTAVLADMAHDWWTEPAWSQGILLPPLAIYTAWMNRERTFSHRATIDRRGILLIAAACLTFLLGGLACEFYLMRIAFVILLTGFVWTFWGMMRLRTMSFPLLVLATMVPLPVIVYNSLAAPLQLLASDLATQAADLVGISVLRDGNVIHLAGTSLGVAEACSGLNSLSALIVGSLLLGYLLCTRILTRMIVFVLAPPLAILVNILRISGTAVLADYNQEFAMGFYHSFSGWLVFVAGFGMLYLVARTVHNVLDQR